MHSGNSALNAQTSPFQINLEHALLKGSELHTLGSKCCKRWCQGHVQLGSQRQHQQHGRRHLGETLQVEPPG